MSCGLKVTTQVNENVLNGNWEMKGIECFNSSTSNSIPRETYTLVDASGVDATIIIDASSVNYTVTTDNCTTSSTTTLKTDFDNDLQDQLDFNEVLSAGTCNEDLAYEDADSGVGAATVKFTMLAPNSKNLKWEVNSEKDELSLQFFTGFQGSSSAAYCNDSCTCYANFEEI